MCNFKIGDEVISLIDSNPQSSLIRKKGEIVTVTATQTCSSCGRPSINVDNRPSNSGTGMLRCRCSCLESDKGLGWAYNEYFAPLQTQSEEADMNEALQEVFERELFQV